MGIDVNGLYRWGFSRVGGAGFAGGLRQLVKDAGLGFLSGGGVM
ncbi:MAG: hypothetical protein ACK59G_09850 [Cyanobacteriota bacterium]